MNLVWEKGGEARVLKTDGNFITVESSISSPPGSSLSGRTAGGVAYHLKVRGCRKTSESPVLFCIDGRLFNLEREPREQLLEAMRGAI